MGGGQQAPPWSRLHRWDGRPPHLRPVCQRANRRPRLLLQLRPRERALRRRFRRRAVQPGRSRELSRDQAAERVCRHDDLQLEDLDPTTARKLCADAASPSRAIRVARGARVERGLGAGREQVIPSDRSPGSGREPALISRYPRAAVECGVCAESHWREVPSGRNTPQESAPRRELRLPVCVAKRVPRAEKLKEKTQQQHATGYRGLSVTV
mmetsp:Transcript_46789/g.150796  ORF Transcript_46789/g.150796 Transcript_46789/m.150796 type:complete len:211 (-) Transcript_46789:34-666(-)